MGACSSKQRSFDIDKENNASEQDHGLYISCRRQKQPARPPDNKTRHVVEVKEKKKRSSLSIGKGDNDESGLNQRRGTNESGSGKPRGPVAITSLDGSPKTRKTSSPRQEKNKRNGENESSTISKTFPHEENIKSEKEVSRENLDVIQISQHVDKVIDEKQLEEVDVSVEAPKHEEIVCDLSDDQTINHEVLDVEKVSVVVLCCKDGLHQGHHQKVHEHHQEMIFDEIAEEHQIDQAAQNFTASLFQSLHSTSSETGISTLNESPSFSSDSHVAAIGDEIKNTEITSENIDVIKDTSSETVLSTSNESPPVSNSCVTRTKDEGKNTEITSKSDDVIKTSQYQKSSKGADMLDERSETAESDKINEKQLKKVDISAKAPKVKEIKPDLSDQTTSHRVLVKKDNDIVKVKQPQPSISKFKMFIFQKYAEKLTDNILDKRVPPPKAAKPSSSCFTDDFATTLTASVIKEASKELNASSQKTECTSPSSHIKCSSGISSEDENDLEKFATMIVDSILNSSGKAVYSEQVEILKDSTLQQAENDLDNFATKVVDSILNSSEKAVCNEQIEILRNSASGQQDDETDYVVISSDQESENNNNIENASKLTETSAHLRVEKTFSSRSDRPLSGYAEKLAELLDEEDDFEFSDVDSDEDLGKSLVKIKNNFDPKRKISVELTNLEAEYNKAKFKEVKSKELITRVQKRRQNKRTRTRGDRPKSLYAQDLQELLAEHGDKIMPPSGDGSEKDAAEESDNDVEDEEILPVSATVVFLEDQIPLPSMVNREDSFSSEEDDEDETPQMRIGGDGAVRCRKVTNSQSKPPILGTAIVIDPGCGALKCGLSGEMKPSCYCPSVIGVPRRFSSDVSKMKKGFYVGDEAWAKAGMLQIEHPIKQDISNWSEVCDIFEYIFEEELGVNSNEHPVLLTELSLTPPKQREKLVEIMFERFNVPSFYLANQSCLAMYSKALVSGLSLNSGFYHTQATPIYEGHALPHATMQLDIGGDDITNFFGRSIMGTQGVVFNSSSEKLVLNTMKQKMCYLSLDPVLEEEKYKTNMDMHKLFTLPDGQEIEIGVERFTAPEILFDPSLVGIRDQPNVVDIIFESFARTDVDLLPTMFENIVVSGGNSKLNGFSSRLENEIATKADNNKTMGVKYVDDAILSTWIGGSVLASISGFRDQWISMEHYTEHGNHIVQAMCF